MLCRSLSRKTNWTLLIRELQLGFSPCISDSLWAVLFAEFKNPNVGKEVSAYFTLFSCKNLFFYKKNLRLILTYIQHKNCLAWKSAKNVFIFLLFFFFCLNFGLTIFGDFVFQLILRFSYRIIHWRATHFVGFLVTSKLS